MALNVNKAFCENFVSGGFVEEIRLYIIQFNARICGFRLVSLLGAIASYHSSTLQMLRLIAKLNFFLIILTSLFRAQVRHLEYFEQVFINRVVSHVASNITIDLFINPTAGHDVSSQARAQPIVRVRNKACYIYLINKFILQNRYFVYKILPI